MFEFTIALPDSIFEVPCMVLFATAFPRSFLITLENKYANVFIFLLNSHP